MRGRCSLKYLTKRLFVIGILAMVPLLVVSGCVLADRLERSFNDTPQEVPKELEIVWETWKLLSDEYITQAELDEAKLSAGAIQGMLEALGDPAPDFLTPDRYQLDAPNLGAIWQVWEILVEEYGGSQELDARLLSEAAIQGMLETLSDRFTEYISPAAYSLQTDDYSAAFEGIGAHVNIIDGRLTIVAPIPDTPAEQAGLAAGDVILAVDGESIQALDLAEAVLKVRGRKRHPGRAAGSSPRGDGARDHYHRARAYHAPLGGLGAPPRGNRIPWYQPVCARDRRWRWRRRCKR